VIVNLPRWLVLLLLLLVFLSWREWSSSPLVQPHGLRLSQAPRQVNLESAAMRQLGDFSLNPRARFELQARVLSAERYRLGVSADLAPLDLALGWGLMSDQAIIDQMQVSQGSRWYILRWDLPAPADESSIMQSSGNMHIIPANEEIRKQAFALRAGEFVALSGYLVDAQGPNGFRWGTSMSRDDTGAGACELFLVEALHRLETPTRPVLD
jgi:hypothetical protein